MKKSYSNPCIKCGKERIVVRTWTEKIYDSIITNTEMRCPNPACQKAVDIDNKKSEDKRKALKLKSESRLRQRKISLHDKKIAKQKPK